MNNIKTLMLLGFLIFSSFSYSQEEKDLESWNSLLLKYKVNEKLGFDLGGQLRLKENISEISEYFSEFGVNYTFFKGFNLGIGLRYIKKNDNVGKIQGYEDHFRYNFDASYKHQINNITLKYRLRYQNKNELGVSSSEGDIAKQNIRFKTAISYNINNWKLDPTLSAEIYNRLEEDEDSEFSKYRLTVGTEYKFKKIGTIGVFYRVEKELNKEFPGTTNIIGFKYSYTLKSKKNEKN